MIVSWVKRLYILYIVIFWDVVMILGCSEAKPTSQEVNLQPKLIVNDSSVNVFYSKFGNLLLNSVTLNLKYHFENADGGIKSILIFGVGTSFEPGFRRIPKGKVEEFGFEGVVQGGYDQTNLWKPGSRIIAETVIRGVYIVNDDNDKENIIPFTNSFLDTVTVQEKQVKVEVEKKQVKIKAERFSIPFLYLYLSLYL